VLKNDEIQYKRIPWDVVKEKHFLRTESWGFAFLVEEENQPSFSNKGIQRKVKIRLDYL
jgi:hypothetical protein